MVGAIVLEDETDDLSCWACLMRFLSLFSGIEAASVAWTRKGWTCAAVAEIKPSACRVLARRYPDVPNLGDVMKITEDDIARLGHLDLLVFGSPCQDLSVAGRREGLAGARSGLFFAAMRIIGWARKHCGLRYALWENVVGAFSSNQGRDFAAVVGSLAGCEHPPTPKHGWGTEGVALGEDGLVEWGTLDAQWFGVPQRRRRVFALADFGDWTDRPPVLLEPESLRGHPPTRPCTGEGLAHPVAPSLRSGGPGAARGGDTRGQDPVVAVPPSVVGALTAAHGLNGHGGSGLATDKGAEAGHILAVPPVAHTLKAEGFDGSEDGTGRGVPLVAAFGGGNTAGSIDVATARTASTSSHGRLDFDTETFLVDGWRVRRLTPTECERLQGFPDGWTDVPQGNKPMADGPRYNMLGDSMAVPVMEWIADQITLEHLA